MSSRPLDASVNAELNLKTPPVCSQPMEVFVDDETKLTLHGLQQYYCKLKDSEKNRKLFDLLDVLEFNQVSGQFLEGEMTLPPRSKCASAAVTALFCLQVVIFVKSVQRCVALSQLLVEQNFPAIAIHRGMAQEERYGPRASSLCF